MSIPPPHSIHREMIGRIGSHLLISLLGQLQEGIVSTHMESTMARPLSRKEFGKAAGASLLAHYQPSFLPHPCTLLPILLARYRQSHDITDWNSSYVRMDLMERYHGQASGIFGCDEHLAGNMPSRGETLVGEVPQKVRPWWGRCLKR